MISLTDLGPRIAIIGSSNGGKSTLATRLAAKLNCSVYHLDQLAHKPNTRWERCPDEEFVAKHDTILQHKAWVVEGNYSITIPQRFNHASAVIWLDPPFRNFLFRYIKRSLANDHQREGNLAGALSQFSLGLIKHTYVTYPKNKLKYQRLLDGFQGPVLVIRSMSELDKYYRHWGLVR